MTKRTIPHGCTGNGHLVRAAFSDTGPLRRPDALAGELEFEVPRPGASQSPVAPTSSDRPVLRQAPYGALRRITAHGRRGNQPHSAPGPARHPWLRRLPGPTRPWC